MFEKDVKEISLLLDFYGELLSERKQSVLALYYNEDFSLAEIAEEIGISRQGARDLIKKAEEELRHLEEKLGLVARFEQARHHIANIRHLGEQTKMSHELLCEIEALAKLFE
jgi:predicted DNA-binding protein YlxM (UPF0122 family)